MFKEKTGRRSRGVGVQAVIRVGPTKEATLGF